MNFSSWHRVDGASELQQGQMLETTIAGKLLAICRTQDGYHALDGICTHAFAHMAEGRLRGYRMICPLHGASFDCRTGNVLGAPAVGPLKVYSVRVTETGIEVEVPF
jgi:nitrite reductase/ring-hydroxylating ferredoxin subunit